MTIEYKMYLKFLWHLYCLGWLKTSEELRREENKVDFLEWQFRNENSSFIHKKLGILLNFLFQFVSFIGVFSISKSKTLVLKTTAGMVIARQPCIL